MMMRGEIAAMLEAHTGFFDCEAHISLVNQ
jgi:hypothetical protein